MTKIKINPVKASFKKIIIEIFLTIFIILIIFVDTKYLSLYINFYKILSKLRF